MTWATVEQVTAVTGQVPDAVTLAMASAMIDTYAGVTEDMPEDAITTRDRAHLRKACIWQAAWIPGKPGLLTHRESHKSTSADAVPVVRTSDSDIMLAPLAARELRNLSWYSTRTEWQPPAPRGLPAHINFLNEESDRTHGWDPV